MITTFNDAVELLKLWGYRVEKSPQPKLWAVYDRYGSRDYARSGDKGQIIMAARELEGKQPGVPGEGTGSTTIRIDTIRADGGTQARAKPDENTISEYSQALNDGARFPPIVVFYDGTHYWLADGFHRLAAHQKHGRFVIEADVRQGTQRDAVLFAAGANATHGLRRTDADKRRAVVTMLRDPEWRQWSNTEIARRCAVGEKLVRTVRGELEARAEIPIVQHRKSADGRVINATPIGGTSAQPKSQPDPVVAPATSAQPKSTPAPSPPAPPMPSPPGRMATPVTPRIADEHWQRNLREDVRHLTRAIESGDLDDARYAVSQAVASLPRNGDGYVRARTVADQDALIDEIDEAMKSVTIAVRAPHLRAFLSDVRADLVTRRAIDRMASPEGAN
jgi:hypothetical protein